MRLNNNQQAFFTLLKAGLWEKDVQLEKYEPIDIKEVYRLAQEQAVVGLVAAGLEHVNDAKLPKEDVLLFIGESLQLEQRNTAMNLFISDLIERMRKEDIYSLLAKGQGIAQCYERPLWRASGDIDILLSGSNYIKAKNYLIHLASKVDNEVENRLHLAFTIDTWEVELHGSMRTNLWKRLDNTIDDIQSEIFCSGYVRSWFNGNTQVFLPRADEDVIIVFTHILQHFYQEGIGLRQVCDLCRLLWVYQGLLDKNLLHNRLKSAGILSEWKAFASFAVNSLGMAPEAIPLYDSSQKWLHKAEGIISFVLRTGNFGHNRDMTYYDRRPYVISKFISFWRHTKDALSTFKIFPMDTMKVWWHMFVVGFAEVLKGR